MCCTSVMQWLVLGGSSVEESNRSGSLRAKMGCPHLGSDELVHGGACDYSQVDNHESHKRSTRTHSYRIFERRADRQAPCQARSIERYFPVPRTMDLDSKLSMARYFFPASSTLGPYKLTQYRVCLLYTSDAADE